MFIWLVYLEMAAIMFDNVVMEFIDGSVDENQKADVLPRQWHHLAEQSSGSYDEYFNFLSRMHRPQIKQCSVP